MSAINDISTNTALTSSEVKSEGYGTYVKRQFKKNKRALVSFYIVSVFALIALSADFLANDKPIYCEIEGNSYFPVFHDYGLDIGLVDNYPMNLVNVEWKDLTYESVIWAWVPYSPTQLDLFNAQYKSPSDKQMVDSDKWHHKLGTDAIGRDVLSGMIHGTRTAFMVGIISMGIASFLGILLGTLSGYFGDGKVKLPRVQLWFAVFGSILGYFYGFYVRSENLVEGLSSGFITILIQLIISLSIVFLFIGTFYFIAKPLSKLPWLGKRIGVPIDIMVTRLIEIVVSIPRIILIISFSVIVENPTIYHTMIIIGVTSWTGIARFARAEMMKVKKMEFIEAAESFGYSHLRIMLKHAIPNSLSPVFIAIAFGIASAILIEATLSFLGVGVPPEMVTWGSMLMQGKKAMDAWWLVVFPGVAIFLMVTLFNLIGEGLTDALDPRKKK